MGLDIYVLDSDISGRVGSYSDVHVLRGLFYKASSEYLKEQMLENFSAIMEIVKNGDEWCPENLKEPGIDDLLDLEDKQKLKIMMDLVDEDYYDYFQNESPKIFALIETYRLFLAWDTKKVTKVPTTNAGGIKTLNQLGGSFSEFEYPLDMSLGEGSNNIPQCMAFAELAGLYKFCNHSDCDGLYTAGDSMDIVTMIQKVKQFIPEKYLDWVTEIESYFQGSVDHQMPLIYG